MAQYQLHIKQIEYREGKLVVEAKTAEGAKRLFEKMLHDEPEKIDKAVQPVLQETRLVDIPQPIPKQ